jgi:5-methylcytosine-specific restriction protein B
MNDFINEHEKNSLSLEEGSIQESPSIQIQHDSTQFQTSHNDAFRHLGALPLGREWSAFNVPTEEALNGLVKPKLLALAIWNRHGSGENSIYHNKHDGTFWYRVTDPIPDGGRKAIAHWKRLQLALKQEIPIIGFLKNNTSGLRLCSLNHLFDCGPARKQKDGKALWLQLRPRSSDIGCDVGTVDIQSMTTVETLGKETAADSTKKNNFMITSPLNQILFGPPGTGKTYTTINEALRILDRDFLERNQNDRKALKDRFDSLVATEEVRFVTFHQSYSYEDFVEGLRAVTNDEKQLEYLVEPGVFKRLCDDAITQGVQPEIGIRNNPRIWKISIYGTGQNPTKTYCFNHGEARIGWGKTGDLREPYSPNEYYMSLPTGSQGTLRYFTEEIAEGDILVCIHSAEEIAGVGVVTGSYYYEQNVPDEIKDDYNHVLPVNWLYRNIQLPIHPLNDGKLFVQKTVYSLDRLTWGDLFTHIEKSGIKPVEPGVVAHTPKPHVLIIDEINRGNISRIFGELITLIEPSKRTGADEALEVILPYSKKPFSVPSNVYLIGTMNTADRSLAGLDKALRRRFTFKEMPPEPELLNDIFIEGVKIGQMLSKMNERIEVLLDRDHCLGHAYFMPLKNDKSLEKLALIFRHEILPLLEEYFFEGWERIHWVLNDHNKSPAHQFIQKASATPESLFGSRFEGNVQDRRWRINKDAFENIESYRGILGASE